MVDRTKKPFSLNQRKLLSRQSQFGYRSKNNWEDGDLPAPYAEGDLIFVPQGATNERMNWMGWGYFVVSGGFSIDEGDAWYFRISNDKEVSDRLHVAFEDRCTWNYSVDWMSGRRNFNNQIVKWQLIETSDPVGLVRRKHMLAQGWRMNDGNRREL